MTKKAYDKLFNYIQEFTPLSDFDKSLIIQNSKIVQLAKKNFLVKEGEYCNQIAFIIDGYFRIYILNDVDEKTIFLSGKNEFIASFSTFITRKISEENVQAITDATIISIDYLSLQEMYNQSHTLERVGRLIIEKLFVEKEERVISFIKDTAEMRYQKLLDQHPDYLLNVPLVYLSSFLGVKPETLSRVRAKIIS